MSYDLAILDEAVPNCPDNAWSFLYELLYLDQEQPPNPSTKLSLFLNDLMESFEEHYQIVEDIRQEMQPHVQLMNAVLLFNIDALDVEELLPIFLQTAAELGLVVMDFQTGKIYDPVTHAHPARYRDGNVVVFL